ncbi:MAG: hypothetical protein K5756_02560 [Clostridiales bacterium]|nr:hypothetical protein [Clostridiales bacterium]
MDDFEKNNELENEAEIPETEGSAAFDEPAEEVTAESADTEAPETEAPAAFDEPAEEVIAESADTETQEEEAPAADEETAEETDGDDAGAETTDTEVTGTEDGQDDGEPMLEGGDLQPCEDITDESSDEDGSEDQIEDTEENIEDIPEEELCKRCFARRRDTSVEGFEYCSVCVDEMAETKLSFGAFFYIVLSTAVFMIAAVFMLAGIYVAQPVAKAQIVAGQHRMTQAMEQLDVADERVEKLNSRVFGQNKNNIILFETGTNTEYRYIRFLNVLTGPPSAGETIEKTETINIEKLPKDLKAIHDEYRLFEDTYDLVSNEFQSIYETTGEPDFDTMIAKIDQIAQENDNVHKPALEYIKYYLAKNSGAPEDVQQSYLEQLEKKYPDCVWLYLNPLLNLYFDAGNYNKVIGCCDKILKINVNDVSAMTYKARAYYNLDKQDKVDETVKLLEKNCTENSKSKVNAFKAELKRRDGKFDEAIAICDNEIEKYPKKEEAYRQKAIALMLKGDMKGAHETILIAYEQADDASFNMLEILAITANKTGDKEKIEEIENIFSYYGGSLSSKAQACIEGTMTVEQIFMEGTGDIG